LGTSIVDASGSLVFLERLLMPLNPKQQFDESDSAKIDKAVSTTAIPSYVGGAQNLKTLKGNVDLEDPVIFERMYKDYGQSDEDVDTVPGFVNRKAKQPITLRRPGKNSNNQLVVAATFEDAVHETVHLNSQTNFQAHFSHAYNEGVTEYFTELVLGAAGRAYRDELELAKGLITALGSNGERDVGEAYFRGTITLRDRVFKAFGTANSARDFREWQNRSISRNREDWKVANRMLASALANPAPAAPPARPAPPPLQGSGSGSGGGGGSGAGTGSGEGSTSTGSGSR
jgi:hypothetical protein